MYIRKDKVSINEFESALKEVVMSNLNVLKSKDRVVIQGESIKAISDRYKCFLLSGYSCVVCGCSGEYFAMERNPSDSVYHLNLYSVVNGSEVLMTKDHIKPKSLGGRNHHSNYQTMCTLCNGEKGNVHEG